MDFNLYCMPTFIVFHRILALLSIVDVFRTFRADLNKLSHSKPSSLPSTILSQAPPSFRVDRSKSDYRKTHRVRIFCSILPSPVLASNIANG